MLQHYFYLVFKLILEQQQETNHLNSWKEQLMELTNFGNENFGNENTGTGKKST